LRRCVRPHPHASEPVVSLITWRTQSWERRLSLRVDSRSQRSRCFHAGTFVARDNRLAISVQTHFFRYRQCGSCRQARALDAEPLRLAHRGGRKVEKFAITVARKERARREGEGAASQLCEEAHRGGDVRARQCAGGGSTVEETCARDSAQSAEVRSQRAWCGGEGDCARKRAGSSAEESCICVEERAFRAR
jgi:hypothetical protein